jgi:subtilisin-like proprotein convertase family protein
MDVNVQTFLQHTFAADLDMTVTSPAGTVVTLSTDNGAGNDNVFNGTIWDDDANPLGQVPYVTNAGLVTDNPYVNLTPAPRLVPEDALGAFIGEDPNGVWTITISDDLAGDGGALNSWSLELTTTALPITTLAPPVTQSTPTAVPTGPAVVTSTVEVAGLPMYLLDLNLTMAFTHTFAADLDMTIMSPAGTVVTLSTDNGAGNDNTFNGTLWDDDANPAGQVPYVTNNGLATDNAYVNLTTATPLVPEEAMAAFIGENPNGTWTITISDDLAGDGGSLDSWTLDVTTAVCPTTTTTTLPTTTTTTMPGGVTTTTLVGGGCAATASYASLHCRIGAMISSVQAGVQPEKLMTKLSKLLDKADKALSRSEEVTAASGPAKKSKRALKQAMRAVKKVGKKLGSKAAKNTPEAVRNALIATGTGVQTDLQAMIGA